MSQHHFSCSGASQRGFTLVEIAVVLTIIGVLLAGGIASLTGVLNDVRYKTTQERMQNVANAIAVFAQRNYRVPCPSTYPASGITTGQENACGAQGIVPYAVIGLTADQVRDAYGNFLSYSASGALTTLGTNATPPCRYTKIWVIPNEPIPTPPATGIGTSINPGKAAFCCPASNGNLDVQDNAGNSLVSSVAMSNANAAATANWVYAPIPPATAQQTQTAAIVLISHGRNGQGALVPANATRVTPTSTSEQPNVGMGPYRSAPYSTSTATAASFFDDIVIWRTQDQLMSAFGRDSCARP